MRTVPVVAAAVWLVGGLGASPFAGLDQAPGVYVMVDGYGLPPHIEITCRIGGGYLPAAEKAVWTVPRPAGMSKWKQLWPWTYDGGRFFTDPDAVDLGLSALVEDMSLSLSRGAEGTRFKVMMQFEVDLETAADASTDSPVGVFLKRR